MRRCSASNSSTPAMRLVVLGDNNVGKTALVVRFLTKRFIGEYASEMEITYRHEVAGVAGSNVTAEICDTLASTSKNPPNMLKKYPTKADVFMVVYSVCSRDSFDYACSLACDIRESQAKSTNSFPPVVIIGNKSDLDHCREVKASEGEDIANRLSCCHFMETSAAESYQQTEKAFSFAFSLIPVRTEQPSPPPPSASTTKWKRKKSFSQVASMIRDHVRKPNSFGGSDSSADGTNQYARRTSMSDRNNNNNSGNLPWDGKKRTRRSAAAALRTNAYLHANDTRQLSKCASLETLCEKPDAELECSVTMPRFSPTAARKNLYQNDKYNTVASAKSSRFGTERSCKSHGDSPNSSWALSDGVRMSVGTDDTADFSDLSTAEEDPFSSNVESSLSSAPSVTDCREEAINDNATALDGSEQVPRRKTSLNKKGLQITIHSDKEGDETEPHEAPPAPPKSAPLLASVNKFRFFPNGLPGHNHPGTTWKNFTRANAPVSPLLSGRRRENGKLPKDDIKRSPQGSLLKQFFKGSFAALNVRSTVPLQAISGTSVTSVCTDPRSCASSSASLTEDCENDAPGLRASSSSLSSTNANDQTIRFDPSWSSTSSAPSSPRCPQHLMSKKKSKREKERRPSFRETVSDLIRKRKKSCSSDYLRQNGRIF